MSVHDADGSAVTGAKSAASPAVLPPVAPGRRLAVVVVAAAAHGREGERADQQHE